MDIVVSSSPQFLEFTVVAWMAVNGAQLHIDHATFHSTRRAVNIDRLVSAAKEIGRGCSPMLRAGQRFRGRLSDHRGVARAVVLRTLQSDHDRVALLLQEERRQAEKIKECHKQTVESIQQLHHAKEDEERIETTKAAAALDEQMKRLKVEGKLLRQRTRGSSSRPGRWGSTSARNAESSPGWESQPPNTSWTPTESGSR
jgi:hypothetical protein